MMKIFFVAPICMAVLHVSAVFNKNLQNSELISYQDAEWSLQAIVSQKIVNASEGLSVALSADGNTLAAGAPGFVSLNVFTGTGETQIYSRSESAWNHQATLTQGIMLSAEGYSVAFSGDGNTLAVGAVAFNKWSGATQIYVRSGTSWVYQTTLMRGVLGAGEGRSVSLSADGNTLAAGATGEGPGEGATEIYVRSGTMWSHQATLSASTTTAATTSASSTTGRSEGSILDVKRAAAISLGMLGLHALIG